MGGPGNYLVAPHTERLSSTRGGGEAELHVIVKGEGVREGEGRGRGEMVENRSVERS